MPGYFEITKSTNGQYMFNLKGDNHHPVLTASETYVSKQGAQNGIDSVKTNAPYDAQFDRYKDSAGEFRFRLNAANNKIIGKSEGYTTQSNRDTAIEWVKTNAPTAPVYDRT